MTDKNNNLFIKNSEHFSISVPKYYKVDWDKVNTVEDMFFIVKILFQDVSISDNHKDFNNIKQYLKRGDEIENT